MSAKEWDMLDEAHQRKLVSEGRTSASLPHPPAKAATQPPMEIHSPKAKALLERIAQGKEHAYALQQLWISLELCECPPDSRQFGIWFVRHEFETVASAFEARCVAEQAAGRGSSRGRGGENARPQNPLRQRGDEQDRQGGRRMTDEFTLLENRLRQPFLETVRKYGKQKFTLWAIWTYMLWRSTNGVFCLPEELVLEDWGMDVYALRRARAILKEEGWLRKDILRNTGGAYLTRTWVLTSPPMLNATVDDPPMHLTTVAKSPYSVSSSGSGSGSAFDSVSVAASHSDSNSNKSVSSSTSKDGGKAEPEPKPTPAAPMAKPPKLCKECGEELKRDENHLLTCPVLHPKPAWCARASGEGTPSAVGLDNWEEL
jgi:hypothetical protein